MVARLTTIAFVLSISTLANAGIVDDALKQISSQFTEESFCNSQLANLVKAVNVASTQSDELYAKEADFLKRSAELPLRTRIETTGELKRLRSQINNEINSLRSAMSKELEITYVNYPGDKTVFLVHENSLIETSKKSFAKLFNGMSPRYWMLDSMEIIYKLSTSSPEAIEGISLQQIVNLISSIRTNSIRVDSNLYRKFRDSLLSLLAMKQIETQSVEGLNTLRRIIAEDIVKGNFHTIIYDVEPRTSIFFDKAREDAEVARIKSGRAAQVRVAIDLFQSLSKDALAPGLEVSREIWTAYYNASKLLKQGTISVADFTKLSTALGKERLADTDNLKTFADAVKLHPEILDDSDITAIFDQSPDLAAKLQSLI